LFQPVAQRSQKPASLRAAAAISAEFEQSASYAFANSFERPGSIESSTRPLRIHHLFTPCAVRKNPTVYAARNYPTPPTTRRSSTMKKSVQLL
jgi:hypothetical protein